jgi:hypothetical protein
LRAELESWGGCQDTIGWCCAACFISTTFSNVTSWRRNDTISFPATSTVEYPLVLLLDLDRRSWTIEHKLPYIHIADQQTSRIPRCSFVCSNAGVPSTASDIGVMTGISNSHASRERDAANICAVCYVVLAIKGLVCDYLVESICCKGGIIFLFKRWSLLL